MKSSLPSIESKNKAIMIRAICHILIVSTASKLEFKIIRASFKIKIMPTKIQNRIAAKELSSS
jgi:hypothetical protein